MTFLLVNLYIKNTTNDNKNAYIKVTHIVESDIFDEKLLKNLSLKISSKVIFKIILKPPA